MEAIKNGLCKNLTPAQLWSGARFFLLLNLSLIICAAALNFYCAPNHFVFGGTTGLSVVLATCFPALSVSTFMWITNAVLDVLGCVFLGIKAMGWTLYSSFMLSFYSSMCEKLFPMSGPLTDQPVLELIFAIALPAIASALLFGVGASSGGTDVIALIVEKYTHLHSIAAALFLTDLVMVVAACFVFDLHTALYSFVGLTVKSLMIDVVLERMKMCKAILIVCDDKEPICDFVNKELDRGATYTPCNGAYTNQPRYIIYTTLTRHEAMQLREFIHKEHLNAFMSMLSTTEVFGKGFDNA